MQYPRLRKTLSIAALCLAAAVCLQIGVIRVTEADRNREAVQELEALRRARSEQVQSLQEELARVEAEVARLRSELDAAASEGTALEDALRSADFERGALRARVAALSETIERERPFIDVVLSSTDSRRTLAASAENRGDQPLMIRESRGWLWVDNVPLALDGSLAPAELAPGSAVDVFEFDPASRALEFVPASNAPVKGALCFVYGRMLHGEADPWVEERWFEYRPGDGVAATIRRDSWPLAEGSTPCDIEAAEPPW